MQKLVRILAALIVVGAIFWAWRILFPNPAEVIRKRLAEMAELATFPPTEPPLDKLGKTRKLTSFCTEDIVISADVPGHGRHTLHGRDNLFNMLIAARQSLNGLTVEFVDLNVTLGPEKTTAIVNLTCKTRIPGQGGFWEPQEFNFMLKKTDGEWLIYRIETVEALSHG